MDKEHEKEMVEEDIRLTVQPQEGEATFEAVSEDEMSFDEETDDSKKKDKVDVIKEDIEVNPVVPDLPTGGIALEETPQAPKEEFVRPMVSEQARSQNVEVRVTQPHMHIEDIAREAPKKKQKWGEPITEEEKYGKVFKYSTGEKYKEPEKPYGTDSRAPEKVISVAEEREADASEREADTSYTAP